MAVSTKNGPAVETRLREARAEVEYEKWVHWPINWSAVFVGSLASLAAVLIFGLIGIALGAHLLGPENRVVDLKNLGIGALVFSIAGAFFAFVIGGWVAGRIAGTLHAEPGMLHGAISWLVATPVLLIMAGIGAGSLFGGWYAGLSGTPSTASNTSSMPFDKPEPLSANATEQERIDHQKAVDEYNNKVRQWREDTPRVTRNTALGALTALLLGVVGSVIGGWLASGEPMNFTHHRTRAKYAART